MQSQPKDGDLVYNNHSDSANGIVCITDSTAKQVQHRIPKSFNHMKISYNYIQTAMGDQMVVHV